MIETREVGDVTVVELAHGKANALDLELCREIGRVFGELEGPPARPVVLASGAKIFSGGVDLLRLAEGGADYAREFLPALAGAMRAVFAYPGPVVAAVNGHAIAGGCGLACAADRRILVAEKARMGIPELLVGVPFPAAALEPVRLAVAPAAFRRLVLTGETFEPAAALHLGLVDELVPPDELLDRALAAANALAAIPADTFAITKRQMRREATDRIDALDGELGERVVEAWASDECQAAIRAWVEKTLRRK